MCFCDLCYDVLLYHFLLIVCHQVQQLQSVLKLYDRKDFVALLLLQQKRNICLTTGQN